MAHEATGVSGKICLVTGATSGIGAETALALAARGATVVGVGRDPARCAARRDRIVGMTGNRGVIFLAADLSSQREVRRLAQEVEARLPRLDLLVNCAGGRFDQRILTRDGLEMTFALNHLAYFLLTLLLFDKLTTAGRARIVNVASGAHRTCPEIDFDDLQGERGYTGRMAYAQSKLANLLFSQELNRRLRGSGVTVNAAAPGNVLTRFASNNGLAAWARHVVGSLKGGGLKSARRGAETVIFLAASPAVEGITGGYFADSHPARPAPVVFDPQAAARLWDESLKLTARRDKAQKEAQK